MNHQCKMCYVTPKAHTITHFTQQNAKKTEFFLHGQRISTVSPKNIVQVLQVLQMVQVYMVVKVVQVVQIVQVVQVVQVISLDDLHPENMSSSWSKSLNY